MHKLIGKKVGFIDCIHVCIVNMVTFMQYRNGTSYGCCLLFF